MKLLQDIIPTMWDRNFQPLAGGSVEVYTDPLVPELARLYSKPVSDPDAELPNPLPLNSAGRFSTGTGADTPVYSKEDGVHVVVRDRKGVIAKEFGTFGMGLDGVAAAEVKSVDDMRAIDGEPGMYALVRDPAPFRWYAYAEGAGTNDGLFSINANGNNGRWVLVPQDNWVYSSWWINESLNHPDATQGLLNFLKKSQPGFDLCINSELNAEQPEEFQFFGKIKLVDTAKINNGYGITIHCLGGLEASKYSDAGGVAFHAYGGDFSASNLQRIRLAGIIDSLHIDENQAVQAGINLKTRHISGESDCKLTVYGTLSICETALNDEFEVDIPSNGGGKVFLCGTSIAANCFKDMGDWSGIESGDSSGMPGGLVFDGGDAYSWTAAPNNLGKLSGHMVFDSNIAPTFSSADKDAKITNSNTGNYYCPIPSGISFANLYGKFAPQAGQRFTGETIPIYMSLDPKMQECTFDNCVFKRDVDLTRSSYKNLNITNCFFDDGSKINLFYEPDTVDFTACSIRGNRSNTDDALPINLWPATATKIAKFAYSNVLSFIIKTTGIKPPEKYGFHIVCTTGGNGSYFTVSFDEQMIPTGNWFFQIRRSAEGAYDIVFYFDIGNNISSASCSYIAEGYGL